MRFANAPSKVADCRNLAILTLLLKPVLCLWPTFPLPHKPHKKL